MVRREGDNIVSLSWKGVSGVQGYVISRSIGSGSFAELGVVDSSTTRFTDRTLPDTPETVRYQITPFAMKDNARVPGKGQTVTLVYDLKAVENPRTEAAPENVGTMVSWDAQGDATEYRVYARENANAAWALKGITFGKNNTKFLHIGKTPGGGQQYFVMAVSRPARANDTTYQAALTAQAILRETAEGPAGWHMDYLKDGQLASASLEATAAQGEKVLLIRYDAQAGTFTLCTAPAQASQTGVVPVWALQLDGFTEEKIRYSVASKVIQ